MTQTIPAATLEREIKKAPELKAGDWLAAGMAETDSPVKVLAALRYSHPESGPSTHLIYADPVDGRPLSWDLIDTAVVTLASADEIAGAKDRALRRRLRDDLRALADLVLSPGLPVERSPSLYLSVPTRADVVAVAERLELGETRPHGKGIATAWPAEREVYEDGLTVTWYTGEPAPEPDAEAEPVRSGPWFAVGERVYPRSGGQVVIVTEQAEIVGSNPLRQQFRADDSNIWRQSDEYQVDEFGPR